jgi:hypothetical protein
MASLSDLPYLRIILSYLIYLWAFICHINPISRARGVITPNLLFRYIRWVLKVWLIAASGYLIICLDFAFFTASIPASRSNHILAGITECARRSNINRCNSQEYVCSWFQKECWALTVCLSQSKQHTLISELVLEWIRQLWSSYYWFVALVSLYILIVVRFSGNCAVGAPDSPPTLPGRAPRARVRADFYQDPNGARAPPAGRRIPPLVRQDANPAFWNLPRIPIIQEDEAGRGHFRGWVRPQHPHQAQALQNARLLAARPPYLVHNDPNPNPEGRLRAAANVEDPRRLLDDADRPFHIIVDDGREARDTFGLDTLVLLGIITPQDPPFTIPEAQQERVLVHTWSPLHRDQAENLRNSYLAPVGINDDPRPPTGLLRPAPTVQHPNAFADDRGRRFIIVDGEESPVPLFEAIEILRTENVRDAGAREAESSMSYITDEDARPDELFFSLGENPRHSSRPSQAITAGDPDFGVELDQPATARITVARLRRYRLGVTPWRATGDGPRELAVPQGPLRVGDDPTAPENHWVEVDRPQAIFRITAFQEPLHEPYFPPPEEVLEILSRPPPGAQPPVPVVPVLGELVPQNDDHPPHVRSPERAPFASHEEHMQFLNHETDRFREEAIRRPLQVTDTMRDFFQTPEAQAHILVRNQMYPVLYNSFRWINAGLPAPVRLPEGELTEIPDLLREHGLLYHPYMMRDAAGHNFIVVNDGDLAVHPRDVIDVQAQELYERIQREQLEQIDAIPLVVNFLTRNNLFSLLLPGPPLSPRPQVPQGELRPDDEDLRYLTDQTGARYIVFRREGFNFDDPEASLVPREVALRLQTDFLQRQLPVRVRQGVEPANREDDELGEGAVV